MKQCYARPFFKLKNCSKCCLSFWDKLSILSLPLEVYGHYNVYFLVLLIDTLCSACDLHIPASHILRVSHRMLVWQDEDNIWKHSQASFSVIPSPLWEVLKCISWKYSAKNSRISYDGWLWYVDNTKATYRDSFDCKSLSLIVSVITQDPEEQFSAMNSTFK